MSRARKLPLLEGIAPEQLARAAATIRVLGHPDRLKILEVMEGGEVTVTDIQERVGLSQATVSQHLAKLRAYGIVAAERAGQNVFYTVAEPKVEHILQCIRKCDI